jgi:hypothetical protein
MARVFTEGAEMGDTLFWDVVTAAQVHTAQKRTGSYSYGGNTGNTVLQKNITAISEFYYRYAIYESAFNDIVLYFRNSTTIHAGITTNSSNNKVYLQAGGSAGVASSTHSILTNTWNLFEVYVKVADSPNGRVTIKINGVTEIDYTGDVKNGASTTVDNIYYNENGATWYIDDLALNDTTGGVDDSWCGDGHIVKLAPDGNGATSDWDGSDGNSTDNYLLVDEVPSDGDTTYVSTSTSSEQDQYSLSAFDGTGKVISRIYVEARAKKTTTDADTLKLGVLPSGGSDEMSSALNLSTNYSRIVGPDMTVNPDDSAAWEDADLDALELVIEKG